ncbi:ATP-binding protein [Dyella sp.]|uniref:ATP-binding protein n=1 Tax=Dyella sp. TaxID=1869338 RepID=UPI002ED65DDF
MFASLLILLLVMAPATAGTPSPLFDAQEQQWIRDHPVVEFAGYPDWLPFETVERGQVSGLALDYLSAISRVSGLTFRPVLEPDLAGARSALSLHKLDLLPTVVADNAGVDAAHGPSDSISAPYFVGTAVIITRESMPNIYDLSRLQGHRVAVREHGVMFRVLSQRYPKITLLPMASPEQELRAVSDGLADAAVDIDALLMPLWRRGYFSNLHVSGMVNDALLNVRMRVRDDEPLLKSIIDKSLASLSASQTDAMMERWMTDSDFGAPSWRVLLRFHTVAFVTLAAGLALLLMLYVFARRDRQRAMRSEQEKALFLATMSHEIRLPVSAIFSGIELLRTTSLDEDQQRIVNTTAASADALLHLVDDILDLSRLEANGLTLMPGPVDLRKITDDVVNVVLHKAQEKMIPIHVDLFLGGAPTIYADAIRLEQVLINLLSNAIKFTERGAITLEMTLHRGQGPELPAQLSVRVKDTGIGIAANRRNRLFQAYEQADNSIQRRYGGAGLGLNICRQLVELMGGVIDLDSEVGVGTTVAFTLPVTILDMIDPATPGQEPVPAKLTVEPIEASRRPSILLVEDHPANRFVIEQQLRSLDCRVTAADSGQMALGMIARESFDLILLDCNLPDIGGYELARRIRGEEGRQRHTPIVAISANTNAVHKMSCIESGMDGVLAKPLQLAMLRAEIALWCDFESVACQSEDLPPSWPNELYGDTERMRQAQ